MSIYIYTLQYRGAITPENPIWKILTFFIFWGIFGYISTNEYEYFVPELHIYVIIHRYGPYSDMTRKYPLKTEN